MISVYGSTGFVGSRFCEMHEDDVLRIPREQNYPESDSVLYFISTTHNYHVYDDPYIDINTNLTKLIDVLQQCRDRDMVFNFVSSWFVYGKTNELPAKEDSICNPKGFYSITKRTAEQMLISYCETFGIKYRIFRLCNVLGESDTSVSNRKNAVQLMIQKLCDDDPISLYHNGEVLRDYMYVDDVCSAIMLCVDDVNVEANTIINIGSGEPTKIKDIIQYANSRIKSLSKISNVEPSFFHNVVQIRNMYLDTTKLNQLGFSKRYSIHEALDKIIDKYIRGHY